MGIEKSELKKALLGDLKGEAVERHDGLQANVYRTEGSILALKEVVEGIERDVYARLKRDIDEGKIDPETEAKQVHRYIQTCVNFAKHMGKTHTERLPIQKGQVLEASMVVKMLGESAAEETKKIDAVEAAKSDGTVTEGEDGELEQVPTDEKGPSRRPRGVRPASSLKARRGGQETEDDDIDLREPVASQKPSEAPPAAKKKAPAKKKRATRRKRGGKDS